MNYQVWALKGLPQAFSLFALKLYDLIHSKENKIVLFKFCRDISLLIFKHWLAEKGVKVGIDVKDEADKIIRAAYIKHIIYEDICWEALMYEFDEYLTIYRIEEIYIPQFKFLYVALKNKDIRLKKNTANR